MPYTFTNTGAVIYDDYITTGVPASGVKQPAKADIRTHETEIENYVLALDTRATTLEGQIAPLLYDPRFGGGVPASPPSGFATETYVDESKIIVPDDYLQALTRARWRLYISKTAAGVAAPVVRIKTGTAGNIGDTTRCALTFDAQTAAADTGWMEIEAVFRSVGNSNAAVLVAFGKLEHRLAATGLSTSNSSLATSTSSGFNSNPAGNASFIGLSIDAGASAAWTVTCFSAVIENLA